MRPRLARLITFARAGVKFIVGRGAQALLGRRNAVRVGRFLLDEARLDSHNRITHNGELLVQQAVLAHWSGDPVHVIDVGAHFGEWSTHLLEGARRQGRIVSLHAFEPTSYSFERLERALSAWAGPELTLNRRAASSHGGTATLHKPHEGAGSSSLHVLSTMPVESSEEVELVTIDDYCEASGLNRVALLKIDAEGHDMDVLRGARRWLEDGRIAVVQFEYNRRWISPRAYLLDAFDFLSPLGFRIGKVTRKGIELYDGWHPELETFRENNYVGLSPEAVGWLPTFAWWNR